LPIKGSISDFGEGDSFNHVDFMVVDFKVLDFAGLVKPEDK